MPNTRPTAVENTTARPTAQGLTWKGHGTSQWSIARLPAVAEHLDLYGYWLAVADAAAHR